MHSHPNIASNLSPTRPQINTAVKSVRNACLALMFDPISVRQSRSTMDQEVRGLMCVRRVTFPAAGESQLSGLVIDSVRSLGADEGHDKYSTPEVFHVQAEWVGWRSDVSAKALEPSLGCLVHAVTLNSACDVCHKASLPDAIVCATVHKAFLCNRAVAIPHPQSWNLSLST